MEDRGHLMTELRNARSERIDRMSIAEAADLMISEDASITAAVAAA
jgi:N-acetylmuramic acid 6-phosphate (MurNAc-6-P) etherase